MDFWSRTTQPQKLKEPAAKRISTPAGQRLSVILENGDAPIKPRDVHRASVRKSGLSAILADPRESIEEANSHGSSGYSYSVWSDGEKFAILRNHRQITKRGGWKKVLIALAIVIAGIVALAVGLAVGLKKKGSNSSTTAPSPAGAAAGSTTNAPLVPNPTATTSLSPSSTPSNFPLGTYSIPTFLDTVQTNCTSNPATWTCYPYTVYNTSPTKSLATFTWNISSPSPGKFQISSTNNPFSISFGNTDLQLLDQGTDDERYTFQLSQTKMVSPTTSLTNDNAAVQCEYDDTSLQASLYTKMAKSYPEGASAGSSYPEWPFAMRVEQSVGGGQNVPSCHKLNNGQPGDPVTNGLTPQPGGQLCSCLYKNWRTPSD